MLSTAACPDPSAGVLAQGLRPRRVPTGCRLSNRPSRPVGQHVRIAPALQRHRHRLADAPARVMARPRNVCRDSHCEGGACGEASGDKQSSRMADCAADTAPMTRPTPPLAKRQETRQACSRRRRAPRAAQRRNCASLPSSAPADSGWAARGRQVGMGQGRVPSRRGRAVSGAVVSVDDTGRTSSSRCLQRI